MSAADHEPSPAERHSTRRHSGEETPPPSRLLVNWLGWWVACAAVWMVLDDTILLPELVDGAVAAAIGASAATLTMVRSPVRFSPRARWLRRWWRPCVQFLSDLPMLVGLLARALRGGSRDPGGLREIPFRSEAEPARRAAQEALASVAGSFAPGVVVVAIDHGSLIVHELEPGVTRSAADPLELG